MDIQELPAIRGNRKREYKISMIHLRTRLKYSEIHPSVSSKRVAEALKRAVERLPPFFLVVTDNATLFTMAYTAHPERKADGRSPRTAALSDQMPVAMAKRYHRALEPYR